MVLRSCCWRFLLYYILIKYCNLICIMIPLLLPSSTITFISVTIELDELTSNSLYLCSFSIHQSQATFSAMGFSWINTRFNCTCLLNLLRRNRHVWFQPCISPLLAVHKRYYKGVWDIRMVISFKWMLLGYYSIRLVSQSVLGYWRYIFSTKQACTHFILQPTALGYLL